jgi:hypothetical protein
MRIDASPDVVVWEQKALKVGWHRHAEMGTFSHVRSSLEQAHFFRTVVSLMPPHPIRFLPGLLLQDCRAVMATQQQIQHGDGGPLARNVSE